MTNTIEQIPENFSGIVEINVVCTNVADNSTRTVSTTIRHYLEGHLHRVDGPAVEHSDGSKEWWYIGKRCRMDGPAVEYADGRKEWWVDGQHMLEKQFDFFRRISEEHEKKKLNIRLKARLPPTYPEKKKKI